MKNLPYFHWYPADAETDENFSAMSDAEVGFLLRCLNHSWVNGGLPADMNELARVRKVRRSYLDKMWVRVGKCFETSEKFPGRLINPRQEKEREVAISKSLSASESAKIRYERSANAVRSQEERSENAPLRASDSVYDSDSGASFVLSSPDSESGTKKTPVLVTAEPKTDAAWDRYLIAFYAGGKLLSPKDIEAAQKLWKRLSLADRIGATESAQEIAITQGDPQFIPFPVNHLRNKQWQRSGPGRMLPVPMSRKPSRAEIGQKAAAEDFLAEGDSH